MHAYEAGKCSWRWCECDVGCKTCRVHGQQNEDDTKNTALHSVNSFPPPTQPMQITKQTTDKKKKENLPQTTILCRRKKEKKVENTDFLKVRVQ